MANQPGKPSNKLGALKHLSNSKHGATLRLGLAILRHYKKAKSVNTRIFASI